MPKQTLAIPAALQITVCPNCGYSLLGLPSAGICPECGRTYNQNELILYGWARGHHETIANAKRSRLVWVIACSFFYLVFQLHSLQSFITAGAIAAASIIYFISRRQSDHPGLVQIRMTDVGCVQYDDLAGPSVIREILLLLGWLMPAMIALGLLFAWGLRVIPVGRYFIWFLIALVLGFLLWRSSREYRRAFARVRDGSVADINAALVESTLWSNVGEFTLTLISSGNRRLKIESFQKFAGNDAVDAEIQCTQEQAEAIENFIRARTASARAERHQKMAAGRDAAASL